MKKIINIILSICILFVPYTFVYADDGLGSITLHCFSDGGAIEGQEWNIYLVGERVDDENIELIGDFADYPVSFGDMSSSAMQNAAKILENYAILDGLDPNMSGVTDANGDLYFGDLDSGVYLVFGDTIIIDNVYYFSDPIFVEIDLDNPDFIDLDVYPKYEFRGVDDSSEQILSVRKVWKGDYEYIDLRPTFVEIEIYRNEVLVEIVELNSSNDWIYEWAADTEGEWRVEEVNIPDDYNVFYRFDATNNRFEVVNSHILNGTDEPDDPVIEGNGTVVEEETEVLLPETGGVGKIMFNILGLSMMLYSFYLLCKRR